MRMSFALPTSLFCSVLFLLALFTPQPTQAAICTYTNNNQSFCVSVPQVTQNGATSVDYPALRRIIEPLTTVDVRTIGNGPVQPFCLAICQKPGQTNCGYDPNVLNCSVVPNVPTGYEGPLPPCSFTREGCRNLDDFVVLAINVGRIIFSFLGTIAFVMFIYGGVMMIISFGSPDRFKKGQQILIHAVIGVIISLSAYLAIDFLLDTLQVSQNFRGVNL